MFRSSHSSSHRPTSHHLGSPSFSQYYSPSYSQPGRPTSPSPPSTYPTSSGRYGGPFHSAGLQPFYPSTYTDDGDLLTAPPLSSSISTSTSTSQFPLQQSRHATQTHHRVSSGAQTSSSPYALGPPPPNSISISHLRPTSSSSSSTANKQPAPGHDGTAQTTQHNILGGSGSSADTHTSWNPYSSSLSNNTLPQTSSSTTTTTSSTTSVSAIAPVSASTSQLLPLPPSSSSSSSSSSTFLASHPNSNSNSNPNWGLIGRQLSQIAGDMSTSVRQNETMISLFEKMMSRLDSHSMTIVDSLHNVSKEMKDGHDRLMMQQNQHQTFPMTSTSGNDPDQHEELIDEEVNRRRDQANTEASSKGIDVGPNRHQRRGAVAANAQATTIEQQQQQHHQHQQYYQKQRHPQRQQQQEEEQAQAQAQEPSMHSYMESMPANQFELVPANLHATTDSDTGSAGIHRQQAATLDSQGASTTNTSMDHRSTSRLSFLPNQSASHQHAYMSSRDHQPSSSSLHSSTTFPYQSTKSVPIGGPHRQTHAPSARFADDHASVAFHQLQHHQPYSHHPQHHRHPHPHQQQQQEPTTTSHNDILAASEMTSHEPSNQLPSPIFPDIVPADESPPPAFRFETRRLNRTNNGMMPEQEQEANLYRPDHQIQTVSQETSRQTTMGAAEQGEEEEEGGDDDDDVEQEEEDDEDDEPNKQRRSEGEEMRSVDKTRSRRSSTRRGQEESIMEGSLENAGLIPAAPSALSLSSSGSRTNGKGKGQVREESTVRGPNEDTPQGLSTRGTKRSLPGTAPSSTPLTVRSGSKGQSQGQGQRQRRGERQADQSGVDVSFASSIADDGVQSTPNEDWKNWMEPVMPPADALQDLPKAKYRTISQVRQERKAVTKRSIATIGRIPLKQYLEVSDAQYREIRRTGRKVYNDWLEENVRLAKQDKDKVLACIHKIEHDHPLLADVEEHWKAKELLQQVIDNAIDEMTLHRKKAEKIAKEQGDTSIASDYGKSASLGRSNSRENRRSATQAGLDDSFPTSIPQQPPTRRVRRCELDPDLHPSSASIEQQQQQLEPTASQPQASTQPKPAVGYSMHASEIAASPRGTFWHTTGLRSSLQHAGIDRKEGGGGGEGGENDGNEGEEGEVERDTHTSSMGNSNQAQHIPLHFWYDGNTNSSTGGGRNDDTSNNLGYGSRGMTTRRSLAMSSGANQAGT